MKVTFEKSNAEAPHIETFWFKPEKPASFVAGQFIELTLPHKQVDNRGLRRWFTVSSAPTDDLLSITTKFSDPGSSFKQALRALQPGTEVTMDEPMGDFVLPQDVTIPLVFVAGGMGVTPFHSILKWLAGTEQQRPIRFIYAVHSEDDIIFLDTFAAADVHATIVVAEPSDSWGGERGHISGDHILKLAEPTENTLFYVAGPEPMIEILQDELVNLKIAKNQIVTDFFPGYDPI